MEYKNLHGWQLTTREFIDIQKRLSENILQKDEVETARFIAGVDISAGRRGGQAKAAVVVLNYPDLKLVEIGLAEGALDVPYIPGLLSFRELPLVLQACRKVAIKPDLIMVDGQGIAHPRRLGIASHLGLMLDIPAIGCAKSRLCGDCGMPGNEEGDYTYIKDKGETIGAVLRTKRTVKPMYISTGHKICLENAIKWVMDCCRGYRLPQPTRLAHLAAGGNLKQNELADCLIK